MKKISVFVFLLLLLNGCGETPKKIYPRDGMFKDKNKTYDLSCFIEFGEARDVINYNLKFNSNSEFIEFIQEDWKPFKNINIVENSDSVFFFTIENDKDIWYQLYKNDGSFGVSAHNNGWCIEKGYKWVLIKDNITMVYKKIN